MSKKHKGTTVAPPTVITLTLPQDEGSDHRGTLLITRGDLAHVHQFTYQGVDDIASAIKAGFIALAGVEAQPPIIPDTPKGTSKSASKGSSAKSEAVSTEPTIDVPLKNGAVEVKVSHLKIVGGETDAAAYRQAALIAGKLIDGGLWDGKSPVRIDDVYAVQRKLQHLSDRELSLFVLTDFVQVGVGEMPLNAAVKDADESSLMTGMASIAQGREGESAQPSLM